MRLRYPTTSSPTLSLTIEESRRLPWGAAITLGHRLKCPRSGLGLFGYLILTRSVHKERFDEFVRAWRGGEARTSPQSVTILCVIGAPAGGRRRLLLESWLPSVRCWGFVRQENKAGAEACLASGYGIPSRSVISSGTQHPLRPCPTCRTR